MAMGEDYCLSKMWRNIKVVSQLMMFAGANFQQGGAWHVQMMLGLLQACYPSRLAVCGSERDEARPVLYEHEVWGACESDDLGTQRLVCTAAPCCIPYPR